MDGVIYRSSQLIPGAVEFIKLLQDWNLPFLFLTNNSQRTRRDVATKLNRMDMPVGEEHIFHLCHGYGPISSSPETGRDCIRNR